MLVEGRKIRDQIKEALKKEVADFGAPLTLGVVMVGDNQVSGKYVELKEKFATEIGVTLRLFEYGGDISQDELEAEIKNLSARADVNGVIIQLPLPSQIETQTILDLVPPEKDVDGLGKEATALPTVVLAVKKIFEEYQVDFSSKKVVVVGNGRLVGRPVSIWLTQEGATVTVLDSESKDIEREIAGADIIISGVGLPGLLKPEMIKTGAVIIDAGTSESGGKLVGDADPACAEKASLFTPVPGGVGPITLAMIFRNLVDLNKK